MEPNRTRRVLILNRSVIRPDVRNGWAYGLLKEALMTQQMSLGAFLRHCSQAERLGSLWEVALEFFHSRRIEMVSYHADDAQMPGAPRLGIAQDGFPRRWVCMYIKGNLSRINPIPDIAARVQHPFLWSQAGEIAQLTPDQERYMQMMAEQDLGDGLAIQVYGPNMRNAYVGLGFGSATPVLTAHQIFELQCAAQMAHIRYCEITSARQPPAELSPRENAILQWIAKGKSNSVIAEILGISRHTVDTMTRRMFEKLDVNDRTSAAVRGLGSGLVSLRN